MTLLGRFQSRAYQKQLADGTTVAKTAYEVSVSRLTLAEEQIQQPAPYIITPREDVIIGGGLATDPAGFGSIQ